MNQQFAVEMIRGALNTAFWVSLPLLAIGFIAGIALSLLQILTSIQDSSFSAVPRLVAFLVALIVFLPWMLMKALSYCTMILSDFSRYAR